MIFKMQIKNKVFETWKTHLLLVVLQFDKKKPQLKE